MTYSEKRMNLFEADDSYYLAHCISSDCALGAGIAVEFQKIFKIKSTLKSYSGEELKHPACIRVGRVYNLITKKIAWGKPTYDSVEKSLQLMKQQALNDGIMKIAMPKIASGLDRLSWPRVRELIKKIFEDTEIEILICYM